MSLNDDAIPQNVGIALIKPLYYTVLYHRMLVSAALCPQVPYRTVQYNFVIIHVSALSGQKIERPQLILYFRIPKSPCLAIITHQLSVGRYSYRP